MFTVTRGLLVTLIQTVCFIMHVVKPEELKWYVNMAETVLLCIHDHDHRIPVHWSLNKIYVITMRKSSSVTKTTPHIYETVLNCNYQRSKTDSRNVRHTFIFPMMHILLLMSSCSQGSTQGKPSVLDWSRKQ